jgi:hypothetical protein
MAFTDAQKQLIEQYLQGLPDPQLDSTAAQNLTADQAQKVLFFLCGQKKLKFVNYEYDGDGRPFFTFNAAGSQVISKLLPEGGRGSTRNLFLACTHFSCLQTAAPRQSRSRGAAPPGRERQRRRRGSSAAGRLLAQRVSENHEVYDGFASVSTVPNTA